MREQTEYPETLTHVHDPPPYVKDLTPGLVINGITVVGRLARGIDSEAHRAASNAGGRKIAVQGSGLDLINPCECRNLAQETSQSGAVTSKFPLRSQPEATHFPFRNRVICGLSLGRVVIEAAGESGSLIMARCGLEQNREVFAVPGKLTSGRCRSPHQLTKQGAMSVEGVEYILAKIAPALRSRVQLVEPDSPPGAQEETLQVSRPPPVALEPHEALLVDMFDGEPLHVGMLIARRKLGSARALEVLLGLELKGLVTQLPETYFVRAGDAAPTN